MHLIVLSGEMKVCARVTLRDEEPFAVFVQKWEAFHPRFRLETDDQCSNQDRTVLVSCKHAQTCGILTQADQCVFFFSRAWRLVSVDPHFHWSTPGAHWAIRFKSLNITINSGLEWQNGPIHADINRKEQTNFLGIVSGVSRLNIVMHKTCSSSIDVSVLGGHII